jgi:cytochrome oxidase Cu insertion factor (SCO1/SenC/PrrC family)
MKYGRQSARNGTDSGKAPAGTGDAAGARVQSTRAWILAGVCTAAVILIAGTLAVVVAIRRHDADSPANQRPTGIPASISLPTINLMGLSPVPAVAAPGFRLTDQEGRTLSLSTMRGKVIVLEFMDPHCTDICPLVSQEFVDAYRDLGKKASQVAFTAVNVNQYYNQVQDVAAFSTEHQLSSIPGWHFFTGPVSTLRATWHGYNITVAAPNPNADIVHTSVIYFIGPDGRERYVAAPMADYTKSGTAYLPVGQLTAWGQGIAQLAETLAP